MRVIVAGSRTITKYSVVAKAIEESPFAKVISEIVHGCCRGVDREAERWAVTHQIKIKRFPAEWDLLGKSAGMIRNGEMAEYAAQHDGALIAIWDGISRGTRGMIDKALYCGLHIYVKVVLK